MKIVPFEGHNVVGTFSGDGKKFVFAREGKFQIRWLNYPMESHLDLPFPEGNVAVSPGGSLAAAYNKTQVCVFSLGAAEFSNMKYHGEISAPLKSHTAPEAKKEL
jgi:hypothetical protein